MHDQCPTDRPDHPPRSRSKLLAALIARGLAVGSWMAIGWWLLGRILNDRFAWSQWAFWTPTELVVLVVGGLIVVGWTVRRLGRTDRHPRRWALCAAWAALTAWMLLVQWRAPAVGGWALFGRPASAFTAMSWNATAAEGSSLHEAISDRPGDRPLDLLVITNPLSGVDWTQVSQKIGSGATATGLGRAKIITDLKILSWGSTDLGMDGRVSATRQEGRWFDLGWAAFFELDTTAQLGSPTVIWLIDLPSDLAIPRTEMATLAAQAIHSWAGPTIAMIEGVPTVVPLDTPGFPEPDLIMGDFNIPRGSRSLGAITGSLSNAWSDAGLGGGVGPLGSWPRTSPVFHIDQTFLSRDLRSCSYELIDLGVGKHRAQLVGITRRH